MDKTLKRIYIFLGLGVILILYSVYYVYVGSIKVYDINPNDYKSIKSAIVKAGERNTEIEILKVKTKQKYLAVLYRDIKYPKLLHIFAFEKKSGSANKYLDVHARSNSKKKFVRLRKDDEDGHFVIYGGDNSAKEVYSYRLYMPEGFYTRLLENEDYFLDIYVTAGFLGEEYPGPPKLYDSNGETLSYSFKKFN